MNIKKKYLIQIVIFSNKICSNSSGKTSKTILFTVNIPTDHEAICIAKEKYLVYKEDVSD